MLGLVGEERKVDMDWRMSVVRLPLLAMLSSRTRTYCSSAGVDVDADVDLDADEESSSPTRLRNCLHNSPISGVLAPPFLRPPRCPPSLFISATASSITEMWDV